MSTATYKFSDIQRDQEYRHFKESLRDIGQRRREDGKNILKYLWGIYSKRYWSIEEGYEGPGGWERYLEQVIAPFFDDDSGDPYFDDFPPVVTTVLEYVHTRNAEGNPLRHPVTNAAITADMLVVLPRWIKKLKTMAQKWQFCDTNAKRDELILEGFTGSAEDVKEKGEEFQRNKTPIQINYSIHTLSDGGLVYEFRLKSDDEKALFERALVKSFGAQALDLHLV